MERLLKFTPEHEMFRTAFGKFLDKEIVPYYEQWEEDMIVPREIYKKFGDYGYLCMDVEEKYGGVEADYLYSVIEVEEIGKRGLQSVYIRNHNNISAPYITEYGTEEQKMRWLPGCLSGETILAVAMTEPGAGSDLAAIRTTAVREGDYYIVNGSKTFISNGINADLIMVAVKTDPKAQPAHRGISLLMVERGMEGFERGKQVKKIGMHAQDTAELFFDNCKVPVANLLGEEGKGFKMLMKKLTQERLSSSLDALAKAKYAVELTKQYVNERYVFGQPVGKFQNTQHVLAKCATEVQLAESFLDQLVLQHMAGKLDEANTEVCMAKYWVCEMSFRVCDQCLQLFGGYGYCTEYPIARQFVDSRVNKLFAGSSEIMLNVIAKNMGL